MEALLKKLKEYGAFDNEDQKVGGIAQRAIDNGYEILSPAQKRVVEPYTSMPCTGVTNPGGYHNECQNQITGDALIEALEQSDDGLDGILCESCRDESNYYDYEREKFFRD